MGMRWDAMAWNQIRRNRIRFAFLDATHFLTTEPASTSFIQMLDLIAYSTVPLLDCLMSRISISMSIRPLLLDRRVLHPDLTACGQDTPVHDSVLWVCFG